MITDFEKWANSKGYDLECRIRKRDDGSTYYDGYKDPLTQLASEAYTRGAVTVKLTGSLDTKLC